MAVKPKEMAASARKVVIRRHLACVSLTVKIGPRRSPVLLAGNGRLAR